MMENVNQPVNRHLQFVTQSLRGGQVADKINIEPTFYPDDKLLQNDLNLIQRMHNVPNCTILESGLKVTREKVPFYFCSCDSDKIHQICEECAVKCHKSRGHTIRQQPPAYIKCNCGEKVHSVNENDNMNRVYKPQCQFHELARHSGLNLYFVNSRQERICLFCSQFCSDDFPSTMVNTNSKNDIPNCECNHVSHQDVKSVYTMINSMGSLLEKHQSLRLNLKAFQMANLLLKCKDTYANLYNDFSEALSAGKILLDKKIHLTNFFYAVKNFAVLSKKMKGLKYFSSEMLNLQPFTDKFINSICDSEFEDSVSQWHLLTFLFQGYKNITLGYHTRLFVKFNMFDLENMSVLHRLIVRKTNVNCNADFFARYINGQRNIVDVFIETLGNVNKTRFTLIETFDVLSSIISILHYLSSFYLFSTGQMLNFCKHLEAIFQGLSKVRTNPKNLLFMSLLNEKETNLFLKIIKTLHMFIYIYNDHIVQNCLDPSLVCGANFFHETTQLGRCVFGLTLKIMHAVSLEYHESNKELFSQMNKVLRRGAQILNLLGNGNDIYLVSLKRSLTCGKDESRLVELLRGNKPSENLSFLNTQNEEINKLYELYSNFHFNKNSILTQINAAIDRLGLTDYTYTAKDEHEDYKGKGRAKAKKSAERNTTYDQVRDALNQSHFLFTVVKLFRLVELDPETNKDIINKIYKLIWFYVDDNADNAIIVLSSNVFDSITAKDASFARSNFELFLHCCKLISNGDVLGYSKHMVKKLTNYLYSLPEGFEEKYICLNLFLKILDSILLGTKSLNFNVTIIKLKNVIKALYAKYNAIYEFMDFLMNSEFEDSQFKLGENEKLGSLKKIKISNSLIFNIFYLLLKITNIIFEGSSVDDRDLLSKVFKREHLSLMLKNKILNFSNLNLRTEILKFYRKCNIDIFASSSLESFDYYIRAFIKQMDEVEVKHRSLNNFPAELYSYYEELVKVSDNVTQKATQWNKPANPHMSSNKFDKEVHEVIAYEVRSCLLEQFNMENDSPEAYESAVNYFEHGIAIPVSLYLQKTFAMVNNLTGEEFLNVFELFPHILKIRKIFFDQSVQFKFFENKEVESAEDKYHLNDNLLLMKEFRVNNFNLSSATVVNTNVNKLMRDISRVKNKTFPAFDYTASHSIFDCYYLSLMQTPESLNLLENFKKQFLEVEESQFESQTVNPLLKIINLYRMKKGILESEVSSLGEGLAEICLEFETSYRNLLLKVLIFLITKNEYLSELFSTDCYFIMFKLLQYHTADIQTELEHIIDEEQTKKFENKKRTKGRFSSINVIASTSLSPVHQNQSYQKHSDNLGAHIKLNKLNSVEQNPKVEEEMFKLNVLNENSKLGFLNAFGDQLFHKLIKVFVSDFNPRDGVHSTNFIEAFNIIKIFKYMCEEHNNFFQGSLIKKLCFSYNFQASINQEKATCDKLNFFDFCLLTLNNILLWSNWGTNSSKNKDYFFDLFSAIFDLLIEIIQGNTVENLSYITICKVQEEKMNFRTVTNGKGNKQEAIVRRSALQVFVENLIKSVLFHDGGTNPILYAVKTQVMNFLLTILEEKNCSNDLKNYVIESLSVNNVIASINNTLKIYFLQKTMDDKSWNSYKQKYFNMKSENLTVSRTEGNATLPLIQNKHSQAKDYKLLMFDNQLYNYFGEQYFKGNEGFAESPEFEFANTLYRYIKIISIPPYEFEEAETLIKRVYEINKDDIIIELNNNLNHTADKSNSTEVNGVKNASNVYSLTSQKEKSYELFFCEQYFIIRFFEKITQMVQVFTKDKQNTTVIFTVVPNITYLSEDSKNDFLKGVNRENQFTKLYDLIRSVDQFKTEMEFNSSKSSSKIYSLLKNLNYGLIQVIMFFYALAINIFMFAVLIGDQRKIYNYTDGTTPPASASDLIPFEGGSSDPLLLYERQHIKNMIFKNIKPWEGYYMGLTIVLIIFCWLFIACYLLSRVPLYYEIELRKYIEQRKVKREEVPMKSKIRMILFDVIKGRDQISTLLFMSISGLIAVIFTSDNLEMFYSIMLISAININPTLKNITKSVQLKYKELLSTMLLTFILIYSYSSIGFYFSRFRFVVELDMQPDNYCEGLFFCFLTHSNGGFRIEGGIGEAVLTKPSFERDPRYYAGRLFYDFISFCVINVLMRELVFGIIIETFRDLRIEEQLSEHDKHTICFICGVTKDELEKDRVCFIQHCEKDHNIWHYINYMIRLKFSDPQDLNAINSYTLEQIEKKYTNWIPLYKNIKKGETEIVGDLEELEVDVDIEKYNEVHQELPINKN